MLDEYTEFCRTTAAYQDSIKNAQVRRLYPFLGISGEVGELINRIKKVYRDNGGVWSEAELTEVAEELGDVMWYWIMCHYELGLYPVETLKNNMAKLKLRQQAGTIKGHNRDGT